VDTDQQAEKIRHDLEALEHTAERATKRLARRVAFLVLVAAALGALAWFTGRKVRNRTADSVVINRPG
jgi:hypothetical protein